MVVFGEICKCFSQPRHHVEGRLIVCSDCGLPVSLPFCKDCKWCVMEGLKPVGCSYPIHLGTDLVTGNEIIDKFRGVEYFRENKCTPRAVFFEHRDK
jgi:hypothetical protein